MNIFKRISAFLICVVLILSMAGCGLNSKEAAEITSSLIEGLNQELEALEAEEAAEEAQAASEPEDAGKAEEADVPEEPAEEPAQETEEAEEPEEDEKLDEHGTYYTKDEVALYIYQYGKLPENYITKKDAEKLGWPGGSLEPYAPGKCIGGSYFGNYEGILPTKKGRKYTECDIDTLGKKSRGAKRIVFSNDGLIYYTGDHYETFELLYGEE